MSCEKRQIIKVLCLLMVATACLMCFLSGRRTQEQIVVYYTNDIHSYIDNHLDEEPELSYSEVASLKNATINAIPVDAGDHLQGTAYGGMDNGASMVQIMNAVGYDVATLGIIGHGSWQHFFLTSLFGIDPVGFEGRVEDMCAFRRSLRSPFSVTFCPLNDPNFAKAALRTYT